MLEPNDLLKVFAASFAAADVAQSKERYASVDEAIQKTVENFGIIYGKMRENKLDAKIENIVRIIDRNQ